MVTPDCMLSKSSPPGSNPSISGVKSGLGPEGGWGWEVVLPDFGGEPPRFGFYDIMRLPFLETNKRETALPWAITAPNHQVPGRALSGNFVIHQGNCTEPPDGNRWAGTPKSPVSSPVMSQNHRGETSRTWAGKVVPHPVTAPEPPLHASGGGGPACNYHFCNAFARSEIWQH